MNALLMADGDVGYSITCWLLENYRDDIRLVVTLSENRISHLAEGGGICQLVFESNYQVYSFIQTQCFAWKEEIDFGLLLWWPRIVKDPLLSLPMHGFINTHPSLLPYSRGKHYNFWALVEQSPFGVSLHFVNEHIDGGDIIAQSQIEYGWEDNGETLYFKAKSSMVELFKDNYPKIRSLQIQRQPQDFSVGSFHLSKEIDAASQIHLNQSYTAKDLINVLRARTFRGHPACWFRDGEDDYEVRIEIRRKSK